MSRHDHRGLPKKGEPSRNPGGRPRAAEGWRESIRTDETLRTLALQIAKGEEVDGNPEMVRWLLDQGFGRAPSGDTTTTVHAELARIFGKLRERMTERFGPDAYVELLGDLVDEPRQLAVGVEPADKEIDHG